MSRILRVVAGFLLAVLVTVPARAAVIDSAANGFSVVEKTHISASPDKIYAALVTPARWWSSKHTFSQDAANLTLDPVAGGCWCEKLANGGTVQHLVVVQAVPAKALVMRGALGPLQGLGVEGAMTISLKPATDGTDLSLTYNIGGYLKDGFASWAAPVDGVLGEQVTRLKAFIETGSPEAKPQ
ncbi:MAG TPA: SRPBCC family protein [Rhizomicrobium sp.]|jgi:uncharacterized protein YndB with AHSA1/START domain